MGEKRRHQATLRLVGGIDFSSSSQVRGISRCIAKRTKRACHLPGMPIDGQLRAVDSGTSKASERALGPPKRPTISRAQREWDRCSMTPIYPFNGQYASPFYGMRPNNGNAVGIGHNEAMEREKRIRQPVVGVPYDEGIVKGQMAERLKTIRKAIAPNVCALAKALGIPASTYRNYESATSWLPYDVIVRLTNLGASLEYLFDGVGQPKREKRVPKGTRRRAKDPPATEAATN